MEVTLTGLAVRNLGRNWVRTGLTAIAVACSIVAFVFLRTVVSSWTSEADGVSRARLVTRQRVSFLMKLPLRYVDDCRKIPGVKSAAPFLWFGGKLADGDEDFGSTLATDTTALFDVYGDTLKVDPAERAAFIEDRQGALVGSTLAKKHGWAVGQKVVLVSGFYPVESGGWSFVVRGIFEPTSRSLSGDEFFLHYEYVNDGMAAERKDEVGWIMSRLSDGADPATVATQIDAAFENREAQTLSQDEQKFQRDFLGGMEAILGGLDYASMALLGIIGLIVANTIAMGVRERVGEYGVLRALGFSMPSIFFVVLFEAMTIGTIGGVLGTGTAWLAIRYLIAPALESSMGAFFPHFGLTAKHAMVSVAMPALLATVAGLVPSIRAARTKVVDAFRMAV